ncbi:ATP-grasp domain-containing protein [Kitasatospora sp. GP82]|uniref:ATP-grasp domain-containing protein n=1 Tax=Kitasatospora sp. GP82 TaxID=3035089 RepID=UPI002476E254|nr:ATP-grasp domain-containing protein [Kitasatospora sp. GP82]MDH6123909.1 hypothetical protein [Kitasatospora sp. GP82]
MTQETVLVLTPFDLSAIPLVQWLSDRFRVVLIASRNATNQLNYPSFLESVGSVEEWRWVENLYDDYATVEQAQAWHERFGIRHVVCLDEKGLIFAAQLRELLGVETGQRLDSALAYRIKPRMYQAVMGSVPVPEFVVAASSFEVMTAIRDLELPLVVKPVDGAGSTNTFVLRDRADADRWLREHQVTFAAPVLVQRFVDGDMFHVDGLTKANEVYGVTVSKYGGSTLGYQDSRALTSTMVEAGSEVFELLTDSVERVVRALPDTGGSAFHAEFFVTDDGRVYFCEVASRGGGAGVGPCYELATGVDLFEAHALLQCGLEEEVLARLGELDGARRFGWYLETAPKGKLLALPARCDLAGVVRYDVLGRMGQSYDGPKSSVDAIQRFIVETPDERTATKTFDEIGEWCSMNRLVAENGPVG